MTPNPFQKKIIEAYLSGNENIFVSACPGSGKTTTLVELMKVTPPSKRSLFVAFNKSIADELALRVPGYCDVGTIHSKALKNLIKLKGIRFIYQENAHFSFVKANVDKMLFKRGEKSINQYCFTLGRILSLCESNLVKGEGVEDICDRYGIDYDKKTGKNINVLMELKKSTLEKLPYGASLKGDFSDILLALLYSIPSSKIQKYDNIFLDEVQDISPLLREVTFRFLKKGGRLISVGDEKQTIYSFQGSNLDSLHYIRDRENTIILPLSISYRCSQSVVEEARTIFEEDILPLQDAPQGSVREDTYLSAKGGDYILCRNNAPLFEAFINLLEREIPSTIIGKDLEEGLISTVSVIIEDKISLEEILMRKVLKLKERGIINVEWNEGYRSLREKIEILNQLYNYAKSWKRVISLLDKAFESKEDSIILSTIHKAKGLEADNVYLLRRDLIPSKYACTDLELYNEKCLMYVAITRAKENFIYCTD